MLLARIKERGQEKLRDEEKPLKGTEEMVRVKGRECRGEPAVTRSVTDEHK